MTMTLDCHHSFGILFVAKHVLSISSRHLCELVPRLLSCSTNISSNACSFVVLVRYLFPIFLFTEMVHQCSISHCGCGFYMVCSWCISHWYVIDNNIKNIYPKSNIQCIERYEFRGLIMIYTIITVNTHYRNIIQVIRINLQSTSDRDAS